MIAPHRTLSVLVPDPELARGLPRSSYIRKISDPTQDIQALNTFVFVVISLPELPRVAGFVREANQRHYLKGLFVRDDRNSHLLPQFLHRANLRTLSNLIVHSDPSVPGRVLRAFGIGAEKDLIADVRLIDDRLFLISCSGRTFDLAFGQHPALREVPETERTQFVLAPEGAYVHWPQSDIHLDLEEVRIFLDPQEREKARANAAQKTERFGLALAAQRRRHGLRQTDIPGISQRQIRRYEHGARVPLSSLRLLAQAHKMELSAFLDDLAELAGRNP